MSCNRVHGSLASMWLNHVRISVKILTHAFFMASRSSAPHPGWGSRPRPVAQVGPKKDPPFTVTPAIVAVSELINRAVYNSPIAQIHVNLYLWEYIDPPELHLRRGRSRPRRPRSSQDRFSGFDSITSHIFDFLVPLLEERGALPRQKN